MSRRRAVGGMARLAAGVGAAAAVAVAVSGCGGASDAVVPAAGASSSGDHAGVRLALVGYSTPKTAFDALVSGFERTSAGKGLGFSESFAASGSQSRAVDAGQPADVVAFSTTPDMTRLVKDKLVSAHWNVNPEHGFSSDSLVVFVVRKGNPKHIAGWRDLVRPGVDVITPNPSTSGSARWNILAAYGAQLEQGRTPAEALAYVRTLLTAHVSVQDPSGSAALETFTGGKGDVLLSYESEAIAAKRAGDPIQIVYPAQTLLIQTPIAVTARSGHAAQARAFLAYQWSVAGQTIWAREGYRPVLASVAKRFASTFPTPPREFTIEDLGGWTRVTKEFFDPTSGSITKIEQAAGVPTAAS